MVVCGFPRSGTSLVLMLLYGSVTNRKVKADRESKRLDWQYLDGEEIIIKGPHLLEQKPERPVIMLRDPRAVITSRMGTHTGGKGSYFIGLEGRTKRSAGIYGLFLLAKEYTQETACFVKYEDLVADPDAVQRRIGQWWGLDYSRKWSDYPKDWKLPDLGGWDFKLNGVRPIDKGHDWRDHMPRVEGQNQEQIQEILEFLEQV